MKLENIYFLCKKHYECISNSNIMFTGLTYVLEEGDTYRKALNQLNQIECLKNYIENHIKITEEILEYASSIENEKLEAEFNETKITLLSRIEAIIDLYESIAGNKEKVPGIDIKLPSTNNFTDFKRIIDEVEFIITKCPFFHHKTESLKFAGIDVGSQWLSFVISGISIVTSGSILLNNIAAFIDKCIIIRSHYLTTESQKQLIENSAKEQDEKEELIKSITKVYNMQVDNAINELERETEYKISDGDERGRVEQALQRTIDLIDKGLQILASIDTKQETKALFEPLEMQYLAIENKLKVIEDKKKRKKEEEEK